MGPTELAIVAMGVIAGGATDARPITLATQTTGTGVTVEVVGSAAEPVRATYTLEVSSGAAGSNRTMQSGTAQLEPGKRVVLLSARLGGQADYEIVAQAD